MSEIKNAVIKEAGLFIGPDYHLMASVLLDYGNFQQYFDMADVLVGIDNWPNKSMYAAHFVHRLLLIADVQGWDELAGKAIRVRSENGVAKAIAHILSDDWFEPGAEFARLKNAIYEQVKEEIVRD